MIRKIGWYLMMGVILCLMSAGCAAQKTLKQPHRTKIKPVLAYHYFKKEVPVYWLKYQQQLFFVTAHQPNPNLATRSGMIAHLSQETTQELSHDAYQKMANDGFIFRADNRFQVAKNTGYGIVQVAIPKDFPSMALRGQASLNDPLYNQYYVFKIKRLQ